MRLSRKTSAVVGAGLAAGAAVVALTAATTAPAAHAAVDDYVVATKAVTANGIMDVNVSCPDGTRAISGFNSVFLSSGSKGEFHQYASYPVVDSKTWKFIFKVDNGYSNYGGTLGVMCAKDV
ncbi:hypothetical protein ABZ702_26540 [Streptomyces cyaneofuscatus]|uniref:hypothetical protein n=1 Tax=Streptomyces cyaneofuscatus TaxID=66883 RepID=UPI0033CF6198